MIKRFYLPFNNSKVNYIYILSIFSIAEYNTDTKRYDTVRYKSIDSLAKTIGVSKTTMNRILERYEYSAFFIVNKKEKTITIQNDFTKSSRKFVILTNKEVKFLLLQRNNLLCKYFIYIKHFCGTVKTKDQDFTARQFLSFFQYSNNSHSYLDAISSFNSLLVKEGYITIKKYRDCYGQTRNIYTLK